MNPANRVKVFLFFIADIAALYVSLFLTLAIRYGVGFYEQLVDVHLVPFTIIFIPWLAIFYISGLYDLRRLRNNLDFFKTLFLSLSVNAIIAALLFYVVPAFGIAPKTNLLIFVFIFALLEFFWRRLLNRLMAFGGAPNRALIVGNGNVAKEIVQTLQTNPQLGYSVTAEVTEEEAHRSPEALAVIARRENVNVVIVPRSLKHDAHLAKVLYELFGHGMLVTDRASFYEFIMRKVPLTEIEEAWFLENIAAEVRFYDPLKRATEFIAAIALSIVLIPFELIIIVIIKLTSRGPVIYKQVRVGQKAKPFTLYKFRTMRQDAEKNGPQWSGPRDARVTAFGKFLRASHLDELPQLWNILKGELSFVGPRPERPEIIKTLEEKIPYYEVRLLVKPGVTGWAQINYRKDVTTEDVMEKLQYDIYYLKNRSPILDWAIILKTLKSLFVNPE